MALRPLADLSPGDWLMNAPDEWATLVTRGPSGFSSYARVLHARVEDRGDERLEGCLDPSQLAALIDILAHHTSTPESCFHALWDGFGDIEGGAAASFLTAFSGSSVYARLLRRPKEQQPPPAFPPAVIDGPRLELTGRNYLLFAGPLADAGRWGAVPYGIDIPRDINSPNLLWPADHAWFLATDIDQGWTGVAGSAALLDELLTDPHLEVVRSAGAQ